MRLTWKIALPAATLTTLICALQRSCANVPHALASQQRAVPSAAPSFSTVPHVLTSSPVPIAAPSAIASSEDRAEELPEEAHSGFERAQLARLPVIMAIRGNYESARERYDAVREALARSGPTNEAWVASAPDVFESWNRALGALGPGIEASSLSCFVAGCETHLTFPDMASYERTASAFRSIPESDAKHGGRIQTPPIPLPDGTVQAAWLMLRPDSAPPL